MVKQANTRERRETLLASAAAAPSNAAPNAQLTRTELTPEPAVHALDTEQARRSTRLETEALIAALIAAIVGGGVGLLVFKGVYSPIWQDFGDGSSVGLAAALVVGCIGFVVSVASYLRALRLPKQSWRRLLPWWKKLVDVASIATVHAALAMLITGTVFFVLQHAFRRLMLGTLVSSFAVAAAAALAAYTVYLSIARLSTVSLWQRLLMFMIGGVLLAMATSSDPIWWRYHFSHLGSVGGWPSVIFNTTMVLTGALIVTFALYIDRDVRQLWAQNGIGFRGAAPTLSFLVVLLGISFMGIGLMPVNVSLVTHNIIAGSTAIIFALLLVVTPIALWRMPWSFHVTTVVILIALGIDAWLRFESNYFNLTSFELVAFVILFGWIAIFVRFVTTLLDASSGGERDELSNAAHESDAPAHPIDVDASTHPAR